jgi:hypothetical protein
MYHLNSLRCGKRHEVLVLYSESRQLPSFVEWGEKHNPPTDEKTVARIVKVENAGDEKTLNNWSRSETTKVIRIEVKVVWVSSAENDDHDVNVVMDFSSPSAIVRLDKNLEKIKPA